MNKKQEAFWKLTPEKQRVAIAKDVIKQLELLKIKPKLNSGYVDLAKSYVGAPDAQVCDVVANQKCTVCALGGMMVSAVQLADKLRVSDIASEWEGIASVGYLGADICYDYLRTFFTREQLRQIEAAFEGWTEIRGVPYKKFEPKVRGAANRMILVMKNIIKNKGTFVWPKEKVAC